MTDSVSDILSELLEKEEIGTIELGPEAYATFDYSVFEDLVENSDVLYVSVNRTTAEIRSRMEEEGLDTDKIFFIDALADEPDDPEENVVYIRSPRQLTDISIAITQFARLRSERRKFLVFDSLSALSRYTDEDLLSRFSHSIIGKIRGWKMGAAFFCVSGEMEERTRAVVSQLCDIHYEG